MNIKFQSNMNDFIGRDKELNDLSDAFESIKKGNTKMLLIEADTGVGKTRLIQEFYHILSIKEDASQYWPDNLEDTKHTMSIVPEFQTLVDGRISELPWLWLAIRCHNKDERNSNFENTALSQIRKQIRLHLGAIFENKKRNAQNVQALKSSLTLVANYAFPGLGSIAQVVGDIVGTIDKGIGTYDSIKNLFMFWQDKGSKQVDRQQLIINQEYNTLVDQTFETFSAIFNQKAANKRFPIILVIDDAQWADSLTLDFLMNLIERGTKEKWPLLIIATCWESSLKEQKIIYEVNSTSHSFGAFLTKSSIEYPDSVQILPLKKLITKQMVEVINLELPNISLPAKEILSKNCSGDLEILWDFIRRIKSTPGYLTKNGELNVPIERLKFKSFKKKELVRERILEIGQEIACLIAWGSAQGIRFSKTFLNKCIHTFQDDFMVDLEQFVRIDNPLNITKNEKHPNFVEVAEFRRRIYYEVARELLDDMPHSDTVKSILLDYYIELSESEQIHTLEPYEQISILEELRHLLKQNPNNDTESLLHYVQAGMELLQIYLTEGLFTKCFDIGEELIINYYNSISPREKEYIISILIEASFGSGNIKKEEYYIGLYSEEKDLAISKKPEKLLYQSRFKLRCSHTKQAIQLAIEAVNLTKNRPADYFSYQCYEQLVKAYFYAGENLIGINLLNQMERKFESFLRRNEKIKSSFEHNISLLCHNIDLNERVVHSSRNAKESYGLLNDKYNSMLSSVNLADALMAIGKLKEAEEEIQNVYNSAKETNWKHAHNIAAICYANILYCQGRISEALNFYEEGILLSKEINHNWDILYGRIWRELCLSEFGNSSDIEKLNKLIAECEQSGYEYLSSLARCFAVIINFKINRKFNLDDYKKYVNPQLTPGLYAQIIAIEILLNNDKAILTEKIEELLNITLDCQGVKGDILLLITAIDKHLKLVKDENTKIKYSNWKTKYANSIVDYIKEVNSNIESRYSSINTKIKKCSGNCGATCCYDGVYLNKGEEENIKKFILEFPTYFNHLPKEYIIDGNWNNLVSGRKTNTRPHHYTVPGYPKHFENTRCVFAYDNGLCSLQIAAVENDLHPWKYKPKACWVFPLNIINGQIVGPPEKDQVDPDYFDENYPGYTKFVQCGKDDNCGIPWYTAYKQEILTLEQTLKKK
ncbi:hypothetical protein A8F94_08155 [Bacillus sp. FJAT-27225]|uniref:tetratricopeptide repeat protein n=1 Tax=Bacillus sp. FJAT-27225 TaxID=1743144 RepID=UPI00080C30E5|nr:tetratricopeptide repeat protein [Bacillus sp. FJAT-27225]OCA87806.1 hypothetical protein A8F94_08155 [Bacillus sp. FJAT-27225]